MHYYDLTGSGITPAHIHSGDYIEARVSLPGHPPQRQPFPPDRRFLFWEPAAAPNIIRVVVGLPNAAITGEATGSETSFLMRRAPEGYRLVPEDAAGLITATPSLP